MHKDYLKKQETFSGQLPSVNAIEVINYFANGKSESDVQGLVRINGEKLSLTLIKTVFSHIKTIEETMVRMLNGTSVVYNPWEIDEKGTLAFKALSLPTNKTELISNIMFVVNLDSEKFTNVYDANFDELTVQITQIIDNIIEVQSGTFEQLRDYLKPEQ